MRASTIALACMLDQQFLAAAREWAHLMDKHWPWFLSPPEMIDRTVWRVPGRSVVYRVKWRWAA